MPLRWNLTFALLTYWSTGCSAHWTFALSEEIGIANTELKMPVFQDDNHPLIELE
jgi:hypothetical protein